MYFTNNASRAILNTAIPAPTAKRKSLTNKSDAYISIMSSFRPHRYTLKLSLLYPRQPAIKFKNWSKTATKKPEKGKRPNIN
jgi:hypothetical protein